MLHRLRQVNFVVADLHGATDLYGRYLGMEPVRTFRTSTGERTMLHAGDGTFVELWQPELDEAETSLFRESRGQGPYELVFETKDLDATISRLNSQGVSTSGVARMEDWRTVAVDQSWLNGARVQIVEVAADGNEWPVAGPDRATSSEPRTLRLRQVAVLVRDLDSAIELWSELFGIRATKRFQVSFTDLEIAVLPLDGKDTFIELAQPTGPDAPSQRFLDRYGEGLYLTIYEIADSLELDAHLVEQEARFTSSRRTENYTNLGFNSIWLHPAGFMGAFTQLSQVFSPDNPWPPAGDDWYLQ